MKISNETFMFFNLVYKNLLFLYHKFIFSLFFFVKKKTNLKKFMIN